MSLRIAGNSPHNFVVWLCPFLRRLVGDLQGREEAQDREGSREGLYAVVLFRQQRHVRPVVVDMSHVLRRKNLVVVCR